MRTASCFLLACIIGTFAAARAAEPLVPASAPVTPAASVPPLSAPPVAATPAPALPMPGEAQTATMMQTMARMHVLHEQLRAQTRDRMLAALSPVHRNFVATLLGELAVAPSPDRAQTARQIDAALSPNERQSVIRIDADALVAASGLARQMQVQLEGLLSPEQRSAMERQMAQAKVELEKRLGPEQRAALQRAASGPQSLPLIGALPLGSAAGAGDAGSVLLRTLLAPSMLPYGIMSTVRAGGNAVQIIHAGPR